MHLDRFAKLSDEHYRHLLRLPSGRPRCVIDTDTRNEIDDQFALTWALLSQDQLNIEGIYAAPYSFLWHWDGLRAAAITKANPDAATAEDLSLLASYAAQLERLERAGIDAGDRTQVDPQGLVMVEPGRGMELSYQEILLVAEKLDIDLADVVFRGFRSLPGDLRRAR